MRLIPSRTDFLRDARQADLYPLRAEFLFDADTAVTAYAKLREPPFGFLLESVVGGEKWARYTFLGSRPRFAWRIEPGGEATSTWTPATGWLPNEHSSDPLAELDAMLQNQRLAHVPGLPRFVGGAVGFLGYDVVRLIERLPNPPVDLLGLPWAVLLFTDILLAIDNLFGTAMAIATVETGRADDVELPAHRAGDDEAVHCKQPAFSHPRLRIVLPGHLERIHSG